MKTSTQLYSSVTNKKTALKAIKNQITKSGYSGFISYSVKVTNENEFYISVEVTIVSKSTCEIGEEVTYFIGADYDFENKTVRIY